MNYAERVKEAVSIRDLLAAEGYTVDRYGKVCCPLHNERTPSFQVYKDESWYCFGCKRGGDVITLAEALYHTDFIGAVARLNNDYHLGLDLTDHRTRRERRQDALESYLRRTEKSQSNLEREALFEAWGKLNAQALQLRNALENGEEIDPYEMIELEIRRDKIGWMLDEL